MSQVWSDVLNKYVDEDKKDQLEAYHNRIKNANSAERGMQQGAENYSNEGMRTPQDTWSKLRSLWGSR